MSPGIGSIVIGAGHPIAPQSMTATHTTDIEATVAQAEEAAAAAFRLAELHLASPDPVRHRAAADLLADVVKGAEKPADYKGQLVNLSEVQGAFELAINTLLADRAFEPALAAAADTARAAYRPRPPKRL